VRRSRPPPWWLGGPGCVVRPGAMVSLPPGPPWRSGQRQQPLTATPTGRGSAAWHRASVTCMQSDALTRSHERTLPVPATGEMAWTN